jgi:protein SCO1
MVKKLVLLVVLIVGVRALMLSSIPQEPLSEYGTVPAFSFEGVDNAQVTEAAFSGGPWLINMFFTSCPTVCPKKMEKISQIKRDFPSLKVLSVSIDPESDTEERLKEYGDRFGATPGEWFLVRGSMSSVEKFFSEGVKIGVGDELDQHSTRLVLVDSNRVIRGYFAADDEEVREKIGSALKRM